MRSQKDKQHKASAPTTFGPVVGWLGGVVELTPLGEAFRDWFREVGRIVLPLTEKNRCLVDEDSDQPAFEGAFAAELWRVSRGREATVFYGLLGLLDAGEDAACDEIKQPATAREPQLKGVFLFFAGFAVGFEVTAINGNIDVLGAFGGNGEFWGGVCHKHGLCATSSIVAYADVYACIQSFYICQTNWRGPG
jgi:hypothetical protein